MAGLEGLLRGRVLGGRFRIEEVIGRGGMGAVYRAVDERLGRKVAVKVITVAMGDDPDTRRRVRARFHREARAAAALPHHPNVVPVYDYGTDEELGLDYIVMELLQGQDLATRLQRAGPPPLAIGLRILREAARGLAVGHRAGLVHRDVKPGNIFLAQVDHDELQVRMVDFGIAKLADEEDTFNQLTQDGRVPHSPAYASPEQLRGLSQLTPASDVYSLGAVGYQLLTGERPFSEADRNRISLGMPVPAPSLRSRNPAIPTGVEEIVQKALAYEPADRFPDAVAMANELDRALRGIPDSPIEPYAPFVISTDPGVDEGPTGPMDPDDDDRTQLLDVEREDDHTLLHPDDLPVRPPAPVAAAPVEARVDHAETVEPRDRVVVAAPRRRTAAWVWSVVLLMLAAVAVWAWMEQERRARVAQRTATAVDTLPPDTAAAPQDTAPQGPGAFEINQQGLRAFREGRDADALELFRQALEMNPDNPEYRQNVGIMLWRLGRPEAAYPELAAAVRANPSLHNAHAYLARIQLSREDTAAAISSLQQYIRTAPRSEAEGRRRAQQQLEAIRIERTLLGEPVDTPPPPPTPPPSGNSRPEEPVEQR